MCKSTTVWHVQVVQDAGYLSEIGYRYYIMSVENISVLYGEVDRVKKKSEGNLLVDFTTLLNSATFLTGVSLLCKHV